MIEHVSFHFGQLKASSSYRFDSFLFIFDSSCHPLVTASAEPQHSVNQRLKQRTLMRVVADGEGSEAA